MPTRALTRIVPHLWYIKEAEASRPVLHEDIPEIAHRPGVVARRRPPARSTASNSGCSVSRSSR